jgi:O-antigen/teichoic acid export membrane protein
MKSLIAQFKKLAVDVFRIITSLDRVRALWHNPLYSNAIYIMSANVANAVVGFVFWIVAARLYSTEEVGQASALLSAAALLAMLSGLGFGYGLIRFLGSSKNPVTLINSSFAVVASVSVAAAVIFIVGPGLWSPAVVSIRHHPAHLAVFVLAVPVVALAGLMDNAFIARRIARYVLAKNLIFNVLRLVLPVVLAASLHSFGIFASWGAAVFVSLLFGMFLFLPRAQSGYRPSLSLDRRAVGETLRFSFANYLGDLFSSAPVLILQSILIVRLLGSESNAYFAIAWTVGSILSTIPASASMSLFAEGSHDEGRLGQRVRQSLKMTFLILTPAVILVMLLADKLLLVFGPQYSQNAATLLRLVAVSTFPWAVNSLYFGMKRVMREMGIVIFLIVLAGVITIGLSYWLLPREGITGVGIAWLVSQSVIASVVLIQWVMRRQQNQ